MFVTEVKYFKKEFVNSKQNADYVPTQIFLQYLGKSILPANVGRIQLRSVNKDEKEPGINYHPL